MDISRLMVFSQQIEDSKLKKDKKRSRMDNDGSNRHGRSKSRQKIFGHCYSSVPKYEDERVSNRRPKGESNEYSQTNCLGMVRDMRVVIWPVTMVGCGESVHMRKNCPKEKSNVREGKKVAPSDLEDGPPKKNSRFMSLSDMCFFNDL